MFIFSSLYLWTDFDEGFKRYYLSPYSDLCVHLWCVHLWYEVFSQWSRTWQTTSLLLLVNHSCIFHFLNKGLDKNLLTIHVSRDFLICLQSYLTLLNLKVRHTLFLKLFLNKLYWHAIKNEGITHFRHKPSACNQSFIQIIQIKKNYINKYIWWKIMIQVN